MGNPSVTELLKAIQSLPKTLNIEVDGKCYQKTFQHTFLPPADAKSITNEVMLKLQVFDDTILEQELQPLYQFANGMKLFYSGENWDDSGHYFIPAVELYPIERLAAETAYMHSHELHDMEMIGHEAPVYLGGLVIGEATGTGNPLILMRWGELAGKIMYADHDPDMNEWNINPFARSLTDLLLQLALPPHTALSNLCGTDRIWFE